jgi:uncharacterized protein YbbC (DUF1343 family)
MPLVDTAVVYPGQVVLEGTNLSEVRGTTRPFEIFGAPYLEPGRVLEALEEEAVKGAILREAEFRPTFNKWAGQVCRGFQIHITDRDVFRPYRFTLALISAVLKVHPGELRWSDPPYEYVTDKLPVDVILGDRAVRERLEACRPVREIEGGRTDSTNSRGSVRILILLSLLTTVNSILNGSLVQRHARHHRLLRLLPCSLSPMVIAACR